MVPRSVQRSADSTLLASLPHQCSTSYTALVRTVGFCRLMRRRIKVADPRIFLVSAVYMHIRGKVVDDNNII